MGAQATAGPPRTVLFNTVRKRWEFNRRMGATFLYDEESRDLSALVSKTEAERIARTLGTSLPTGAELRELIARGEAEANSA